MATSKTGYTTNLPLADVTGGKAWLVWEFDGKPLPVEHGGDLLRIAVSSRTLAGLPYADELVAAGALLVLTREAHGIRRAGRLTPAELVPLCEPGQTAYVWRSDSFAEAASQMLMTSGSRPPTSGSRGSGRADDPRDVRRPGAPELTAGWPADPQASPG
jgi:hypothetical protein